MGEYELDFQSPLSDSVAFSVDDVLKFSVWFNQQGGFRSIPLQYGGCGGWQLDPFIALGHPPLHKNPQLSTAAKCCLEACGGGQECDSHILLKFCLSVWTGHPSPQNHPWEMGREKLRVREVGYFKILPKIARPENPWQNRRTGYFNTFLIPEIPC